MSTRYFSFFLFGVIGVGVLGFLSLTYLPTPPIHFDASVIGAELSPPPMAEVKFVATHIKPPAEVKAIYMTSFVAGDKKWRAELVRLIEDTELNAVVIDIKDYTGKIAFAVTDPLLIGESTVEIRIPDIKEFLAELHARNIYAIARIAAFQDPALASKRPEWAVKRADKTTIWKDYKGQTWIDPGQRESWEYLLALGKEAYSLGFDEINFDYIRFPSDGNMLDIFYPASEDADVAGIMKSFFEYVGGELSQLSVPTSADLFGMTTTNTDDLNIGQVLEHALAHFDYVAPMVYPSHYPANFNGYPNPAEKPYEVVKYSMDKAVLRSSTTPGKLRPWLQDFNLGATYTADMVKAQIQAVYDSGLTSWMLWNAGNKYTRGALSID